MRTARRRLRTVQELQGQLVSIERDPEAVAIKREIERRWPDLEVYEDLETREFVIIHRPNNAEEYIALKPKRLTWSLIDRISAADQASAGYVDFMEELEKAWAEEERDEDWKLSQIAGDAAERLAWAFKKDGLIDHDNIYGAKPKAIPNAIRRGR